MGQVFQNLADVQNCSRSAPQKLCEPVLESSNAASELVQMTQLHGIAAPLAIRLERIDAAVDARLCRSTW
jgi:hypothetical protein